MVKASHLSHKPKTKDAKLMSIRQNSTEDKEDILKYLIEDYQSDKPKAIFHRNILYSDAQVIMIGGTDTIAAAMSHAFYYLARSASLREQIREELAPVFGKTIPGEFAHADVATLTMLNAVLDETMRLHNSVGNSGARCTPPEGMTIDGQYIPGDVTVFVGIHAMHRSRSMIPS
jgi:cytochrome P450